MQSLFSDITSTRRRFGSNVPGDGYSYPMTIAAPADGVAAAASAMFVCLTRVSAGRGTPA
jgi:hypothetical protein